MADVIPLRKRVDSEQDAYGALVEDLMNTGLTYNEIEEMKEEAYDFSQIGRSYLTGSMHPKIGSLKWQRISEGTADVTVCYRSGLTKEFKGVAL